MDAIRNLDLPSVGIPEERHKVRLLGLYEQRQPGMMMQRIKFSGGRLELAQWRTIAELARRLAPGEPLRLTTRQNIEFHGIKIEAMPELQRALADAGLSVVGACGDTIRAVTVDPESGLSPDSYDLGPLAELIHDHAQSQPDAFSLPRKFKISLSGSPEGKARPYINDVGLVANEDGTLRAVVAGSLGAVPSPGIVFHERLTVDEILPFVMAALRLFAAEGDRANRARARFRHVRERMGNEAFLQALQLLFVEEKGKEHPAAAAPLRQSGPPRPAVRLSLPGGTLRAEDALALVDLAERRDGILRIGLEHDLWLFGIPVEELPERLRTWVAAPNAIACPGSLLCQKGIVETGQALDMVRAAVPANSGLFVAISGCPNGCTHPAIADIGFFGRLKKIGATQFTHYRLLAGGGGGRNPKLAIQLHEAVPLEQVGVVAAWLAGEWNKARQGGCDRFTNFVERERKRLIAELHLLIEKSKKSEKES